ncbi:hypothetical protein J7L00_06385 [Candidatus Bathyarchaeota archaeon]|nr:hypothetical protein [Candidatus Bathyarchaeota archaeon]
MTPLGIGPTISTFTSTFGGEAYTAIKFRELLNGSSVRKFKPRIIVSSPVPGNLRIKRLGVGWA